MYWAIKRRDDDVPCLLYTYLHRASQFDRIGRICEILFRDPGARLQLSNRISCLIVSYVTQESANANSFPISLPHQRDVSGLYWQSRILHPERCSWRVLFSKYLAVFSAMCEALIACLLLTFVEGLSKCHIGPNS
jgi:hypothetical protein